MRPACTLAALCTLFGAAAAYAQPSSDIIKHTGKPVGKHEVHNGGKSRESLSHPAPALIRPNAFGLPLLENRLLADSFARAGFLTVMPDIFRGDPAPHDITFDAEEFLRKHTVNVTDPVIEKTVDYIRNTLKVNKIAVTGYCFGGRYAFRFLAKGRGADVGYAAHPSFLQDDEVLAVDGPASIAAAEHDPLFEPERRLEVERLLGQTPQPFQVSVYSGTAHGFGTRGNVSIPEQKFGKEEAFFQAVRWFNAW
ncbi:hypothetical protein ACJ41O_014988 [Fusarium nematophilum]